MTPIRLTPLGRRTLDRIEHHRAGTVTAWTRAGVAIIAADETTVRHYLRARGWAS